MENGETEAEKRGEGRRDKTHTPKKIRRFVTTALVRDKTILSSCALPRASSDSLILHREHCFQHESSVPRTCPFRFTVPVRSIPESRYSSLYGGVTRQSNDRPPVAGYRRFPSTRTYVLRRDEKYSCKRSLTALRNYLVVVRLHAVITEL